MFENASKAAVEWIWVKDKFWTVKLSDGFNFAPGVTEEILENISIFIEKDIFYEKIEIIRKQIPLDKIHITKIQLNSPARRIIDITKRLKLLENLKKEHVLEELSCDWEPLTYYHIFTYFDLLGQNSEYKKWDNWIKSDDKNYHNMIESLAESFRDNPIEFVKKLFDEYNKLYSVRNSFRNFINKILDDNDKKNLLNSIYIEERELPPKDIKKKCITNENDKIDFIFKLRNYYTHSLKQSDGVDPIFLNEKNHLNSEYRIRLIEIEKNKATIYSTKGWPDVLDVTIKKGLASFIRNS